MSKQRKFVLISAVVGVIATFLPWWSLFGFSINGFHGMGVLAFLCFIAAGVMAYMNDQTINLNKTTWMLTLIAGGIAALIILYYIIETSSAFNALSFGIYLAALAAIGIVLSAFLFKSATDNLKDGFSSLKSNIENRIKSSQTTSPGTTTNTTNIPPSPDNSGNTNPPL